MKDLEAVLHRFAEDEAGATAIEYGMIAALIAVGAIMAMTAFGGSLGTMFNTISTRAGDAMANAGS